MDAVDAKSAVRGYYEAIDGDDYDRLERLLSPSFTHYRPDRTLEGRGTFVRFMREERPTTDTDHAIDELYLDGPGVAVRGRLLNATGEELFAFVDVFTLNDGKLAQLRTFSN